MQPANMVLAVPFREGRHLQQLLSLVCLQQDVSRGSAPLSTGPYIGSDMFVLGKHKQLVGEGEVP